MESKKTAVSFRIDSNILKKLNEESVNKEVSLNTLANQIFRQFVHWYSNAPHGGMIPIFKPLMQFLLSHVDDKEMVNIGKKIAKENSKDLIFLLTNEFSPQSSVGLVETWIKASGFTYKYEKDGTVHKFFIAHDIGKKYSLYLSALFGTSFSEFEIKTPVFDITDNGISILIDIDKPLNEKPQFS
jgi:hypothetical protein